MSKYQNRKIYKIVDVGYIKCYIGSTCEELSQRVARHRAIYKQYMKGKKTYYLSAFNLFDEFGLDNYKIELVEAVAINNHEELRQHERIYIQSNDCINTRLVRRTDQQYYKDNKEAINQKTQHNHYKNQDTIIQKYREYYQKNKTKILANQAQTILCQYGSIHRKRDKAKHLKTKIYLEYIANAT